MSYSRQLTNLAFASEQSLGRLVDAQVEENVRTANLDGLESAWEDARADGVVDGRELAKLVELSRAAGTTGLTKRLEELEASGHALDEAVIDAATELLAKSLRDARLENGQGSTTRQLLLQLGMSEMKSLYESASAASRTEHQAYMTAIANMKA